MRSRPPSIAFLLILWACARAAGEPAPSVPLEVLCGSAEGDAPAAGPPSRDGARRLPDLPFDPARGYGYLGGDAGRLPGAAVAGGGPGDGPVAWREAPRKYSFRVPNGEYLLRLSFVETEAAEPGLRVFDVLAEDAMAFAGVDIAGEAGDFRWLWREGLVRVRDGWLDLGFLPRSDSLPPRISRIRIEPADSAPATPEPPPGAVAEPGPLRVTLSWGRPPSGGIAGYGVFRAESRDGPFESLTPSPVMVPSFADEGPPAGAEAFYRIRAYGVRGGQSPFTPVLAARPGPSPTGLRVLELSIPDADLRRLHARAPAPVPVRGTLLVAGASYPVEVSCPSGGGRWQAKKSYAVRVDAPSRRALLGRREFLLLAEAGDPTLLREKLVQAADELAGLPARQVSHVHLLLNGRYRGIYVDLEPLGPEFRRRANLDRYGPLAEVDGRLLPGGSDGLHGRTPGQSGDQGGLTRLVEELSRLDEGEVDGFFEERFYLDRLIDRLAMDAVRGVDPSRDGAEPPRHFLEDSRNGKFSLFEGDHRGGDFGIVDFEFPGKDPPGARSLFGFALDAPALAGSGAAGRWRVLETRLFGRPALRARYLARIEAILSGVLTPERLGAAIASVRAPLAEALFPGGEAAGGPPVDLFLWPGDRGSAFRAAPAAISAAFRAHRSALLEAVAAERAREPDRLAINEVFLRPGAGMEGGAWIEIYNRSRSAVEPAGYFLTADLDRPLAFRLPAGPPIEAGERRVVVFGPEGTPWAGGGGGTAGLPAPIPCGLRPSPDGGELGLFREGPGGRAVLADHLFYGHRTAGFAHARLPDGSPNWASVAPPTPGAPNGGKVAGPPPWKYRSGLEPRKAGEYRLWLQVTGTVESAAVHLREEGFPSFETVPLAYTKETFRHEMVLGPERLGRRIDYYFTVRSPDGLERAYPLPGPRRVLRVPVKPTLFINEVLPRPRREGAYEEFVEIYNASGVPVPVDGLFLSNDRKNSTRFRISSPEPVPARGFLLIHADGRGEGTHANFHLRNAGGYIALFTRSDEGNVMVDQVAYPAIPVGQSYGREQDGAKVFKVWRDPTPGARNIPRIPTADRNP